MDPPPRRQGRWRAAKGKRPFLFYILQFYVFHNEKTLVCFLYNYIIGFNNNNNKELDREKRPKNVDLGVINTHRSQLKPRKLIYN